MLNIILYQPEIPYNTGAIATTCALTKTRLHLVKPLGFSVDDSHLKRAGLDYWPLVDISYYDSFEDVVDLMEGEIYFASTHGHKRYTDVTYKDGDAIVFGRETSGLPKEIMDKYQDQLIRVPMRTELRRSLNLANSANIVLFEALRQNDFFDLD